MTPNLNNILVGALLPPADSLWFGTVSHYDEQTFTVTVTTINGNLSNLKPGYLLSDGTNLIRIKGVLPGSSLIFVAENEANLTDATLISYGIRVPFTRYQKLGGDGMVYKDWDIGWSNSPMSQPPAVLITPEAIWCRVGESVSFTGENSVMVHPATSPSTTLTWDAGTGGSVVASGTRNNVVNVDAVATWSTPGFRYLEVTGTDANGITQSRYIPVWVDSVPLALTGAKIEFKNNDGVSADLEFSAAQYDQGVISFLQTSPVVLVDMLTREVIFYGFFDRKTLNYDYQKSVLQVTAVSALSYARRLYSYPFVLVDNDTPASWNDLKGLTLGRAFYFLVNWHSNLKELTNIAVDPSERVIKAQYFTAGSIFDQMQFLTKSAFWDIRSKYAGGFVVRLSNLYTGDMWTGAFELTEADVVGEVTVQYQEPEVSSARLDGVYWDSENNKFVPLITTAPTHPARIGKPVDITGLAPLNAAELLLWAGRHIAVSNNASAYSFQALPYIDPVEHSLVELPGGAVVSVEGVSLNYDKNILRFPQNITSRTQGVTATPVVVPPPPPVIYPPTQPPPVYPPLPPLPPEEPVWYSGVYVGTRLGGVYATNNFNGPDALTQPTWTPVNGGLPTSKPWVRRLWVDPFAPSEWQFCHIKNDEGINSLYARHGGAWYEILNISSACEISGLSGNYEADFQAGINTLIEGRIDIVVKKNFVGVRVLRSTNRGGSFSLIPITGNEPLVTAYDIDEIQSFNDTICFAVNYPLGSGAINLSTNGGAGWSYVTGARFTAGTGIVNGMSFAYVLKDLDPDLWTAAFPGLTKVADGLNLGENFADLWIAAAAPNWVRVLRDGHLISTLDGFSTTYEDVTIEINNLSQVEVLYEDDIDRPDWMVLGCNNPTITPNNQPHSIFAFDNDESSLVGKSGAMPGVAPFTGSIPYTSGGPTFKGIQIIKE